MKKLLLIICVTSLQWLETLTESGEGSADNGLILKPRNISKTSTSCFLLNQPNATVSCGACNETLDETNRANITWCIGSVCGNNSEVFQDDNNGFEDVIITPDGNLRLKYARASYHMKKLVCMRSSSDCRLQHNITLSVENSFMNFLLLTKLINGEWHEHEHGRYLCTSGRSYGKTEYSWKFNGNELNVKDLQLPEDNDCMLKDGCNLACLKTLVFQSVPNDSSARSYHVLRNHSACSNDENIDYVNDYFTYVSLLLFGELSTKNEGIYEFSVQGSMSGFGAVDGTKANITISKPNIDSNIEIRSGGLIPPPTFKLAQNMSLVCHGNHIGENDTPQWFKDDELIDEVDTDVSGCHNRTYYYTVHTEKILTADYENSYFKLSAYSSNATLHWCNITQASEGNYSCRMPNTTEFKGVQVTVPPSTSLPPDKSSNTEQLLIIWFGVLNAILMLAIVITLAVWCWIRHSARKQKSPHSMCDVGLPAYLHKSLELEASSLQDGSDPLEFPYDQLQFLHLLGEGNFGCVRKARAIGIIPGDNVRNIVAVKTLKGNARPSDVEDLQQELHILKIIQPHCNILNLLGYCTKPDGPLCLIIEFAAQGSLKHFLTLCKQNMNKPGPSTAGKSTGYYNESKPTQTMTQPVTQTGMQPVTHYINTDSNWYMYEKQVIEGNTDDHCNKTSRLPQKDYSETPSRLGLVDIYYFLLQIAKGMEHIGKMKLIHRDLAARNILIAEGFVLKIGDFGLSRNLTDKDYYRKTSRGMIPVRWMALESLETGLHTYQSDVWSFGVVAWEILTYAEMPYGMENFARSIKGMVQHLKSGGRLPCPPVHGPVFYPMMTSCWAADSNERSSFSELIVMFESQLSTLLAQDTTS